MNLPCSLVPCKCLLGSMLPMKTWDQSAGSEKFSVIPVNTDMRCYLEGLITGVLTEYFKYWPIFQMKINLLHGTQAGFTSKTRPSQCPTPDSLWLGISYLLLPGMKSKFPFPGANIPYSARWQHLAQLCCFVSLWCTPQQNWTVPFLEQQTANCRSEATVRE